MREVRVGDLKPIVESAHVAPRLWLRKLSDDELLTSVLTPRRADDFMENTRTGILVDENGRTLELLRRVGNPDSAITVDVLVPVESYTPDLSMFPDITLAMPTRSTDKTPLEVIHRLLFQALLEICAEGREHNNKLAYHLANLFHNAVLDMQAAAEGSMTYDEALHGLQEKASELDLEQWLATTMKQLESGGANSILRNRVPQ